MKIAVRCPAAMPKLEEDGCSGGFEPVGDPAPTGNHLFCVDAGRTDPADPLPADHGCLGNQQAGGGTLEVVFGHEIVGRPCLPCPSAGHRGHGYTIFQIQIAHSHRFKE
jgi:hypothetical protein